MIVDSKKNSYIKDLRRGEMLKFITWKVSWHDQTIFERYDNDYKTPMKVHLPNKVTDYETTFGKWKIQKKMRLIVFLKNLKKLVL